MYSNYLNLTTYIVGRVGSGKSTIADKIISMLEPHVDAIAVFTPEFNNDFYQVNVDSANIYNDTTIDGIEQFIARHTTTTTTDTTTNTTTDEITDTITTTTITTTTTTTVKPKLLIILDDVYSKNIDNVLARVKKSNLNKDSYISFVVTETQLYHREFMDNIIYTDDATFKKFITNLSKINVSDILINKMDDINYPSYKHVKYLYKTKENKIHLFSEN